MKTNKNQSLSALAANFPFISKKEIEYRKETNTYKTERGFLNSLDRINSEYQVRAESLLCCVSR